MRKAADIFFEEAYMHMASPQVTILDQSVQLLEGMFR
jgi:hypothetical protein